MKRKPSANTIPVTVPANYIEEKHVDKDLETFACLDGGITVGGFFMRAPSLGVFTLLETFDCKAIGNPAEATLEDWMRVFYVNHFRAECVQDVQRWIADKGSEYVRDALPENESEWHTFDTKVVEWAQAECFFKMVEKEEVEAMSERFKLAFTAVQEWMDVCFTGYAMMPPGGGGGSHMFGAEVVGQTVASVGEVLSVNYREILWETPITLIGHVTAQIARSNGAEGISRPKCKEDIKRKLLMAKETIHSGKLLPWQIDHPNEHGLHEFQREHYPKLQKELDKLKEATK